MTVPPTSIPELLAEQARARPNATALRSKRRGIWQQTSWSALRDRARAIALGLRAMGIGPGDGVALVAENSPDWIAADLGIQWSGARSVALPPQTPAPVVARTIARCGVRAVICGDQEQVDLVLAHRDGLVAVEHVLVVDATGLRPADLEGVRTLADVEADGARSAAAGGDLSDPDPAAGTGITVFSAGTAGDPRPVQHGGDGLLGLAETAAEWLGLRPADRNLCVVSLALPAARVLDLYAALSAGAEIGLPEGPSTVDADLAEASPTVLTLTPRGLALLRWASDRRAREASRRRRRVYRWAMGRLEARLDAGAPTVADRRRAHGGAQALVGRWVVRRMGLRRTRRIVVVGGAGSARDQRFFWALGIPAVEVYGPAEVGGLAVAQAGVADAGTAGRALPGVEATTSDAGTLLLRSPLTGGAAYDTGDLATIDADGPIRVHGRRDEPVGTADGRAVVAAEVERALLQSPYVRRAAVDGAPDGDLTALVEVDFDNAAAWAADRDLAFSTYGSLIGLSEVRELLDAEVRAVGEGLPDGLAVGSVVLLPRPLEVAQGELTPVLTVRRAVVLERFGPAAAGPAAG